jgi:hypothetical protein
MTQKQNYLEVTDPREDVAKVVRDKWFRMNTERLAWLNRGLEARSYVTGADTSATEVGTLQWKNRTTIPKLTQIVDGLQSFYMAALMPSDDWFVWEGRDIESQEKANLIEEYMRTKLRMSRFRSELEKIIRDWLIYGTCFAGVTWVKETTKSAATGEEIVNYQGPRVQRISPIDSLINPTAASFEETPYIKRSIVDIIKILEHNEKEVGPPYNQDALNKIKEVRHGGPIRSDFIEFYRQAGLEIDGFTTIDDYLTSGLTEVVEYWGDIYVESTGEIKKNRVITVADGAWVLRDEENPAWNGKKPFAMSSWRTLPDNLYGQSPIDNLVGMQYRCDHLENLKADAFDQIILPIVVVKGDTTEDYQWEPGAVWYVPDNGDVDVLRPDASVLQADNQVALYHHYMEQMAGVPREMMGFRTPGEKTAFEVNALQQGADRQFIDKVLHFEEHMIEPLLNLMFELAIRNMDVVDVARTFDGDTKSLLLTEFTKEEVVADGVLRPIGSKHFAARQKRIQELQNFLSIAQATPIAAHVSGIRSAVMFSEELGWDKYNIVEPNVAIKEQIMAQAQAQVIQQEVQEAIGAEIAQTEQGAQPPQ